MCSAMEDSIDLSESDASNLLMSLETRNCKNVARCVLSSSSLRSEIQQQLLDLMADDTVAPDADLIVPKVEAVDPMERDESSLVIFTHRTVCLETIASFYRLCYFFIRLHV